MDIGAELSGSEGRGRKGGELTVMASFQPASKRDAWTNKSRGEVDFSTLLPAGENIFEAQEHGRLAAEGCQVQVRSRRSKCCRDGNPVTDDGNNTPRSSGYSNMMCDKKL